jgi:hypothetical protein
MNKQRIATIVTLSAILSLSLLLVFRATASAPNQKALVGTWERIALKDQDGQPLTGAAVSSQLLFSADGHYVQVSNPPGRAKLNKPLKDMTKEELLNRFEGINCHYGTYALTGTTLTRKPLSHTNPSQEGDEIQQTCKFEGELLILSGTTTKREARFRRVK